MFRTTNDERRPKDFLEILKKKQINQVFKGLQLRWEVFFVAGYFE